MPPERRLLRVHAPSGTLLTDFRESLEAVEQAYNSLYVLETALDGLVDDLTAPAVFFGMPRGRNRPIVVGFPFRPMLGPLQILQASWPPSSHLIMSLVPNEDRLFFEGARFESPGFWEAIGVLNPLETIRRFLNDRHERRKDEDFRNAHERRKFDQEERAREAHLDWMEDSVIVHRIEEAIRLGASERDIAPLRNELLNRPLRSLARQQDSGFIEGVEIHKLDRSDEEEG
jgi:hypothetical protein